jgi:FixJ family two-component response regulator
MTFVVAVVDDDLRVLESLEDLLESAGYGVRLFSAAQKLLKSCSFTEIDCLISDISMPVIDGFELQRLAHLARPDLPIFLITGHDLSEQAIAANPGSYGFFRKPFNGQELLAAIDKALPAGGGDH